MTSVTKWFSEVLEIDFFEQKCISEVLKMRFCWQKVISEASTLDSCKTSKRIKKKKSAEPGYCQESADNLYALGVKPKLTKGNEVYFQ